MVSELSRNPLQPSGIVTRQPHEPAESLPDFHAELFGRRALIAYLRQYFGSAGLTPFPRIKPLSAQEIIQPQTDIVGCRLVTIEQLAQPLGCDAQLFGQFLEL